MKFLAFDTCLNKTFVTLSEDNEIIDTKVIGNTDEKYHSAFLIPAIIEILKNNDLTMQDIKIIGTNIGPGSFTGIRVCTTIARVFAQQLNAKLLGIPSMQILSKINGTENNSLILMDARKNKFYCAIYSPDNQEIQAPYAIEKEDALEFAKDNYFVVSDSNVHQYLKENNIESINFEAGDFNLGTYLIDLIYTEFNKNPDQNYNWAKIKPLYIQPPSISKPKIG